MLGDSGGFFFLQIHFSVVTPPSASDAIKQGGCQVSTMVLRLVAYSFFWLSDGAWLIKSLAVPEAWSPPERV